ncbi:MAG TPA: YppF family protein [Chondromyces sp.]|nr:YppF family protein [Chondromyces sp.]
MTLKDLMFLFMQSKSQKPEHVNDLLDFLQQIYLNGSLSIKEYKVLFKELNAQGAQKPEFCMKANQQEIEIV